jgi:hypothetical protein
LTYISGHLRRQIIERAGNCCEYCLLSQDDVTFSFHIEHIIAEKHGGSTVLDNLGLSCPACNGYKGTDISSIDWEGSRKIIGLFNPREQLWSDHFETSGAAIMPLTPEGRVTVSLLRFNHESRLAERAVLLKLSSWPCGAGGV